MRYVAGRGAAGGWSEAEVCAEEVAASRKPLRGDSPREPVAPSRGNCQQERRKAPSGSSSTAQSTAPRGVTAAREAAKHHREAAPQCKARHHRDVQPAEPAPSGRATCRTSSIGKSTFWQTMVPNGQVLRG